MEDLTYRLALLVLLLVGLGTSFRFRRRADRSGGAVPRSADPALLRVALGVGGLAYWGGLLLWLLYPPALRWAQVLLPPFLRWLGLALAAAGVVFALCALRHLDRNVTPTAVAREDADLVVSGPYRWVRHPLYSSMLLTVPGFSLLSGSALVFAGGVTTWLMIAARTRREQEALEERFGAAYREYVESTGRFLPRIG